MIKLAPPAYIWKIVSLLVVFLSIKLNFIYLEQSLFVSLMLAFAIAGPVSVLLGWGADLSGQKTVSIARHDNLSNLLASLIFGSVPATIFAYIATSGDLQTCFFVILIGFYRAVSKYFTAVNIQHDISAARAQAGLAISEPILWGMVTFFFLGATHIQAHYDIIASPFAIMSLATFFAFVIIIWIFPYCPSLTLNQLKTELALQPLLAKGQLSISNLLNALLVSLPIVALNQIGFTTEAAQFAVAQRYANTILVFEQIRSRLFSVNFLKNLSNTSQARSRLFADHVKHALATGLMMLVCLLIGASLFKSLNLLEELDTLSFIYAVLFAILTLCEFGIGTILLLNKKQKSYILANIIAGSIIIVLIPVMDNVIVAFSIFTAAKLLYVLMLHFQFQKQQ